MIFGIVLGSFSNFSFDFKIDARWEVLPPGAAHMSKILSPVKNKKPKTNL
jgi:hypothetical protein